MSTSIRNLFVLAMVAILVAAPVAAVGFGATSSSSQSADVAPGAKLAGSVSVQGAELDGEVKERTFGVKIRNAKSNDSKAAVVAEELEELRQRLAELEERKQSLIESKKNGSISQDTFKARMAELHAEMQSVQRLLNDSASVASDLPRETLESKGVNVSAIETLRTQAKNLSGQETAEIARSIAGKNVGGQMGKDRGNAGLPDQAKNASKGQGQGNDNPGQGDGNDASDGDDGNNASDGNQGKGDGADDGNQGKGNDNSGGDVTDTPTPTPTPTPGE